MNITLVFDPDTTGHHREYLNHLYMKAGEKVNEVFIFIVHPDLQKLESHFKWPYFNNVSINYFKDNQIRKMGGYKFKAAYYRSLILRKYVREHQPSHIFLDTIMYYILLLPFLLKPQIKVSGIIYHISFRDSKKGGMFKQFSNYCKYFIFSYFEIFDRIFLLNDRATARMLNMRFRCNKFYYLPDPVNLLNTGECKIMRDHLKINAQEKVFLHFGGLSLRKGTIDILAALDIIDKSLLKNTCFIFSGYVNDDIKPQFSELTKELANKVRILLFEGFGTYEFQGQLCSVADYLLIPYRISSQSSGLLGYAAQYNLPVIGPSDGLLGLLIKSYKLGYIHDLTDPEKIASALIQHITESPSVIDGTSYLNANTIFSFQNCILG